MASQPRTCADALPYRPHFLAKNERNRAMIADYLGGMARREVAAKYAISFGRVGRIFRRQGVVLPPDERARRVRLLVATRRRGNSGRPPVWADCPPEILADYMLLRSNGYRAAEARAMLDPGFRG